MKVNGKHAADPCPDYGVVRKLTSSLALAVAVMLTVVGPAPAQEGKSKKKAGRPGTKTLETKDGVQLKCTYYPGTKGDQTVPVILVHGWGGVRGEFDGLASYLQQEHGHAVIVPDLRGHGGSTKRRLRNNDQKTINPDRMKPAEMQRMILFDLESVKKFLLEENNKGQLNIELLCVVGSEMGAIVGLNWTAQDWSWPQLPAYKQGQDVKAFVLISPLESFRGLKLHRGLRHPAVQRLSAMVLVGKENNNVHRKAKRIYTALKRYHQSSSKESKEPQDQDLFMPLLKTSLQGNKLVVARSLNVPQIIAKFIEWRLVMKQEEYPWAKRVNPLGG